MTEVILQNRKRLDHLIEMKRPAERARDVEVSDNAAGTPFRTRCAVTIYKPRNASEFMIADAERANLRAEVSFSASAAIDLFEQMIELVSRWGMLRANRFALRDAPGFSNDPGSVAKV